MSDATVPQPPELPGLFLRLERMQESWARLDTDLRAYLSGPDSPKFEATLSQDRTGRITCRIGRPLPEWRLLIADIVCDARFLLDNLAYDMVIAATGQDPPTNWRRIEFPIFADRSEFMKLKRNGEPAPGSGLAKMADMDPWVQRVIENMQPYHAPTPEKDGLYVLHEMCNTYKHRLLSPVLFAASSARLSFHPVNCSVENVRLHSIQGELSNGQVIAEFEVPDMVAGSSLVIEAAPDFDVTFPPGTAGEGVSIAKHLWQVIQVERALLSRLTEIQWGVPMALPSTPPHFVMPLQAVIS